MPPSPRCPDLFVFFFNKLSSRCRVAQRAARHRVRTHTTPRPQASMTELDPYIVCNRLQYPSNLPSPSLCTQDSKRVESSLGAGANPNTKDEEGNPVLWLATKRSHQEVVELLLEAGADVNAVVPNGFTALHRSASEGFQGITEALLRGDRRTASLFSAR